MNKSDRAKSRTHAIPNRKASPEASREHQLANAVLRNPRDINARLMLSQVYLDSGRAERACETAAPFADGSGLTREQRLAAWRLLAFASFHSKKYKDAEYYAAKGIAELPDNLDYYFIAAITFARQKRYAEAREHCETYLGLWQCKSAGDIERDEWDGTIHLKHQILSAYGVALNEIQEFAGAERALEEAIDIYPTFDSSYINLALVYKTQGRNQEAMEVIRRGLKAIPDSSQLRQMIDWSGKRATISACMIVKNEEELLPRCLKSIHGIVDEIILVDTGSTDRTLEIAREFGCVIHHFPWQGDFSSARNESMKYATSDWIFIIDADEEFPPEEINKLRVVTNQEELKAISMTVLNKSLETGQVTSFLPSLRLIRRELNLRYFGIVHNRLDLPSDLKVLRADIDLYHYGYDLSREKLNKKLERTRALLDRQLAETPDDVYANFNLAQLLRGYPDGNGPEKSDLIVMHASRVIDNPESKTKKYFGQRIMAFHQKAIGLCNLRRFDEAEICCREALKEKDDYLDPLLTLGDIYNYQMKYDLAKEYYGKYLKGQSEYDAGEEIDNIILHNLQGRHKAWYGLGLVGERINDSVSAIDAYQRVLKNKCPYLDTYLRLGKLYMNGGNFEDAAVFFQKEVDLGNNVSMAYYGLGCAHAKLNKFDESIAALEKSIALEPDNGDRVYTLAEVFIKAGREDEGRTKIIEAARNRTQNCEIYYQAGNYLFEAGDLEAALEMYNNALGIDPEHGNARLNLGNCYFRSGQYGRACAMYEQVLATAPDHDLAYRNCGLSYARLNEKNKALTCLTRYAELAPTDIGIYLVIGELFTDIGRFPEAIGCLEKYLSAEPDDIVGLMRLSDIYMQMGYSESAAAGYKQVLQIAPAHEMARQRLEGLLKSETV